MMEYPDSDRDFSLGTSIRILLCALIALFLELFIGFGLGFQPGWANGWGHISKHTVWAVAMSGLFWVLLVTAGSGVFSLPSWAFRKLVGRASVGWSTYIGLVVVWSLIALLLAAYVYPLLRAGIVNEWP